MKIYKNQETTKHLATKPEKRLLANVLVLCLVLATGVVVALLGLRRRIRYQLT